tara:strand:+ start:69 stop:752 length:684 start_codon:yes stop_codon:yes gene_type:complete
MQKLILKNNKKYYINMNRKEQHLAVQKEAHDIFIKKNTDYGDAFAKYGPVGVIIRMGDKISRLISVTKNGVNMVKDENIRDTLLDLHNYTAMGIMLLDNEIIYENPHTSFEVGQKVKLTKSGLEYYGAYPQRVWLRELGKGANTKWIPPEEWIGEIVYCEKRGQLDVIDYVGINWPVATGVRPHWEGDNDSPPTTVYTHSDDEASAMRLIGRVDNQHLMKYIMLAKH